MKFAFYRVRFRFRALAAIHFPPAKQGNVLRGGFGSAFRKVACVPECREAAGCELRATCSYARAFEPRAIPGAGPSGLADWPRPFVFRASQLDGRRFAAGESFWFDLHQFDLRGSWLPGFVAAFRELGRQGLGPGRGRADLLAAEQLDLDGRIAATLFDPARAAAGEPRPLTIDLDLERGAPRSALVRFLTPTELKSGSEPVRRPDFTVLFARARDRLSTLRALYGSGPLEIDFRAMGERAAGVRIARCDLNWMDIRRRSSRTGQTHPLGGFVGEVEYQGELGEFVPYLRAAQWTGVGRHAVWGNGELQISLP